ncbi:extracellular solute-binding protein [Anaerocolumna sp. MB42-C2]|uniref:extracellular solute-binding protein n=1 Tax=Anaerocolumna sp. MB42-C2 TaxID=3070997 RepID=UPI0027DF7E08|nr:extracellular solute-binding protein [Anaerocolumna sp. MB42-C2]WMJ89054.1 extracellular solute-binding protein [Anaerocolumna sp. MB42-C2]
MKSKLFKKTVVVILAITMIIGMTGCSKNSNTAGKDIPESTAQDNGGSSTSGDSASSSEDVVELDLHINESWWPVNTFTGIIPEEITKKTGVKLNVNVASDSTQLGVMIASGELPDLVLSSTELDRLSNSSLSYSYPELEEKYGVKIPGNDEQQAIAKSLSSDDNYYCLLNWYDTKEEWNNLKVGAPGQSAIFYRKDLLDAAGIPVPTTMEEFKECLAKVKTAYPNMTPYGLGGAWKFQPFTTWNGMMDSAYDGTTYYYDCTAPLYKSYLQYCNSLYRSGFVTAEDYANENEADGHQNAYNNGCVFYCWYATVGNLNQLQSESKKITESADWALLSPLADDNGVTHAAYSTGKGWAGTFVSKTCKNPEAAAKVLSYLYSEEGQKLTMWGREGIDYTEVDGVPQFSEDWLATRSDPAKMNEKYNTWFYLGTRQTISLLADFSGIDESIAAQYTPYGAGYKSYPEVGIAMPTSSSDEGVIKAKLDEMKKNMEGKIIFSDNDEAFESSYTELMDALDKIGVNTYNSYMNEKIKEIKDKYGF